MALTLHSAAAFVATNSICQGEQVPILWPPIFETGHVITFAHTSFKWANLASHNAGVTVAIVGISKHPPSVRRIFSIADDGAVAVKESSYINAYLVPGPNVIVQSKPQPTGRPGTDGLGQQTVGWRESDIVR